MSTINYFDCIKDKSLLENSKFALRGFSTNTIKDGVVHKNMVNIISWDLISKYKGCNNE